ncbi:hypothetical protein FRC04_005257 [Tulasnella sp. 424]|nr:hypothetical protein FRC04_005257 [Tulasnella sp. 424]
MRHPSYPINRAPLVVKPGASLGMAVEAGDDNKSHHHHNHHDHHDHRHEDEPSGIKVDKVGTSWKYKADMDFWEPVGKIRASLDIAAGDKQATK